MQSDRQYKILLINGNSTTRPYRVAPLGLSFLASFLEGLGHKVITRDYPFKKRDSNILLQDCQKWQPDIVGMGIRNLDNSDLNAYMSYLKQPAKIISMIRNKLDKFDTPIIVGGPAGTVDPELVIKETGADCVIRGEGEQAFVEVLAYLNSDIKLPKLLPPLDSAPYRFETTNTLPSPKLYKHFDMHPYLGRDGGYPLQTKRGCPLKCTYCTYSNIEGARYRFLDPETIADEVEGALNQGIDVFEFVDSTFNLPVNHAMSVLRSIKKRNLKARFVGTGLNPINLPPKLLDEMKDLGFQSVILTAESASPKMLESYQKDFQVDKLEMAARLLDERKIQTLFVFLIGGPGETRHTVEQTLQFIKDYVPHPHVAYITSGIRVYPGSPIGKAILAGRLDNQSITYMGEGRNIPFYFSADVNKQWLGERISRFQLEQPNVLCSDQGQGLMVSIAQSILEKLPVSRPLWKYTSHLNQIQNMFRFNLLRRS